MHRGTAEKDERSPRAGKRLFAMSHAAGSPMMMASAVEASDCAKV